MAIQTITNAEQFNNEMKRKHNVVLFGATWCGPCKQMKPIYERLADQRKYDTIGFMYIDIDEDDVQDIVKRFNIRSLPTLVLLKNGEVSERLVGLTSAASIESLLNSMN